MDTANRMNEHIVIGIDGGQTSTKCVLAAMDGRVLAEGAGPGMVHLSAEKGEAIFTHALETAITSAWQGASHSPQPICAIVMGLTGVETGTPEATQAGELARAITGARHVQAVSDADTALFGAHGGQPGIIAIAGTGSHIRGMNASGAYASAGGWGWLLGDEGSAMWLGRAGLMAALHAEDGTAPATALVELYRDHFQLQQFRDAVKRLVYAPGFGAKGFAQLAVHVSAAARAGDAVALQLIKQAGGDLARQVRAVQTRLALPNGAPVAPIGGAFEHVHGLRGAFELALQGNVVEAQHSPAYGAALMAIRLCAGNKKPPNALEAH
jgi:N-acetylglucosamine kinase-like BadF-type ATPase